jgi:predicted lipoprotein with Yx(FWY)xxD motif
VLTDAAGRAVYVFSGDEHGAVTCLGACAEEWPGVPTDGDAVVEGGEDHDGGAQGLGDGRWQATFSGDPLYYYSGDTVPGRANGVGVEAFGGTFSLITKDHSRLTR